MRHGLYWIIKDGQDTSGVFTDLGTRFRDLNHTVPLYTIESDDEFDKTEVRFEAVRFFEPKIKSW